MSEEKASLLDGNMSYGYGASAPSSPNNNDNGFYPDSPTYLSPTSPSSKSPIPTIDTSALRQRRSSLAAIAAAEKIQLHRKSTIVSHHDDDNDCKPKPLIDIDIPSMEILEADELAQRKLDSYRGKSRNKVGHISFSAEDYLSQHETDNDNALPPLPFKRFSRKDDEHRTSTSTKRTTTSSSILKVLHQITSQLPAIATASVLNFMIGIPFGASYFPPELSMAGKEVLGLRMFLFSTMVAQLVFTYKSKFENGIGLQMAENVPFCLELARIVINEQGNGRDAASTLFFLFGLSSVIVGLVFYLLGKLELGRVVYFFPSHVLVGCIGGIGAFITVTSVEVTTNTTFSFTAEGFEQCIVKNIHLLAPVITFELVLRLLMKLTEKNGEAQYPLLGPIYYCCITPVFYAVFWGLGISMEQAEEDGFFFPPLSSDGSVFNADLFNIFTEVHFSSISWRAVMKALPTMLSLTAFSLIHVPINIPAFAISSNAEPDMNCELCAHGISNALSGIVGGLQNYLCYSSSVIYSKSKGSGKMSSLAIVAVTILLYIYGPMLASYVPRCMAGTLLLHVGIDLFIEGTIESYGDYDHLEYTGICLITIVMLLFGMDAALLAGIAAALSTYAAQSIVYQDPIRGTMTGARLRSSAWNRSPEAQEILLDKKKGRQQIYVIQLQGHIFFGNVTNLTDDIRDLIKNKKTAGYEPSVVILDFAHVLGVDSSAAQSIAKLKKFLLKSFDLEVLVFVTGNEDGFRCTYNLSHKVVDNCYEESIKIVENQEPSAVQDHRLSLTARALQFANNPDTKNSLIAEIPNSRVCLTLDDALIFAEDVLIALEKPEIFQSGANERFPFVRATSENINSVKKFLEALCPEASTSDIDILYNLLEPEKYLCDDTVWEQGDASSSLKLVVEGSLISLLEDEHGATESIFPGSTIGELGLVHGIRRLTTVKVTSSEAILYSLSREKWDFLTEQNPRVARFIDCLVIRYLAHRVQHVSSSNILDRRSLPV